MVFDGGDDIVPADFVPIGVDRRPDGISVFASRVPCLLETVGEENEAAVLILQEEPVGMEPIWTGGERDIPDLERNPLDGILGCGETLLYVVADPVDVLHDFVLDELFPVWFQQGQAYVPKRTVIGVAVESVEVRVMRYFLPLGRGGGESA
jgi:hypothetical protein